jgi:hypothetical protein
MLVHLPEEDPVVIGWLTRVTLTLAMLGVVLFDTGALLAGRVSIADQADAAAQAAADSWRTQHNWTAALTAAQAAAGADEVVPGSLQIQSDGATSLALHGSIDTMVVRHVPRSERLTSVIEHGSARAPLS